MRLLAPRDDLRVGAGLAAVGRVARPPLLRSVGEERVVQEAEEVVQGEGEVGVLVPVEEVEAAAQPDEGGVARVHQRARRREVGRAVRRGEAEGGGEQHELQAVDKVAGPGGRLVDGVHAVREPGCHLRVGQPRSASPC